MFAEKVAYERDMLSIINEGACGNGITNIKANSILNDNYPCSFPLKAPG
jgi:3-hydroxyisobutyrate dehydrogenase